MYWGGGGGGHFKKIAILIRKNFFFFLASVLQIFLIIFMCITYTVHYLTWLKKKSEKKVVSYKNTKNHHYHYVRAISFVVVMLCQLEESSSTLRSSWETGERSVPYNQPPPQSEGFFEPLQCSSSCLQIGYLNFLLTCSIDSSLKINVILLIVFNFSWHSYNPTETDQGAATSAPSGFIPGWML